MHHASHFGHTICVVLDRNDRLVLNLPREFNAIEITFEAWSNIQRLFLRYRYIFMLYLERNVRSTGYYWRPTVEIEIPQQLLVQRAGMS